MSQMSLQFSELPPHFLKIFRTKQDENCIIYRHLEKVSGKFKGEATLKKVIQQLIRYNLQKVQTGLEKRTLNHTPLL